jgi:hypothetical protein
MENVPTVQQMQLTIHDPQKIIDNASQAAKVLKSVVDQAHLAKKLGGDKEHLFFEAWQTVAGFYGATPKIEWTKEIADGAGNVTGYNSRAVVLLGGQVIGAAEGRCSRDEDKWNTRTKYEYHYIKKSGGTSLEDPGKEEIIWEKKDGRSFPKKKRVEVGKELVPLFQLESMSQTRAMAKALRSCYAWVVVLAGYASTPAEEMDGVIEAEEIPSENGKKETTQQEVNFLDEMKKYKVKVGKDKFEEILTGRYGCMKVEDIKPEDQPGILGEMEKAYAERTSKK